MGGMISVRSWFSWTLLISWLLRKSMRLSSVSLQIPSRRFCSKANRTIPSTPFTGSMPLAKQETCSSVGSFRNAMVPPISMFWKFFAIRNWMMDSRRLAVGSHAIFGALNRHAEILWRSKEPRRRDRAGIMQFDLQGGLKMLHCPFLEHRGWYGTRCMACGTVPALSLWACFPVSHRGKSSHLCLIWRIVFAKFAFCRSDNKSRDCHARGWRAVS